MHKKMNSALPAMLPLLVAAALVTSVGCATSSENKAGANKSKIESSACREAVRTCMQEFPDVPEACITGIDLGSEEAKTEVYNCLANGGGDACADKCIDAESEESIASAGIMQEIIDESTETITALGLSDGDDGVQTASRSSLRFAGTKKKEEPNFFGVPFCALGRPLKQVSHPFFYGGYVVEGGAVGRIVQGVESVVDVYNQQAAAFTYTGGGVAPSVGFSIGMYTGLAVDHQSRVNSKLDELWSGMSFSASGSVGLGKFLNVGASGFWSQDFSIEGVAVTGAIGLGVPLGGFADVSVSAVGYTFSPKATKYSFGGDGKGIVRFSRAVDVMAAIKKVSPGIHLENLPLPTFKIASFLVSTILKLKAEKRDLNTLCPG